LFSTSCRAAQHPEQTSYDLLSDGSRRLARRVLHGAAGEHFLHHRLRLCGTPACARSL
jgi:hypothetical protein